MTVAFRSSDVRALRRARDTESWCLGARRRCGGGGSEGGCARMPVGTYLYLHAVGVGNHVYISLHRTSNGHMCTLDSGGVLALHL
jgi:hypothetical protein